MINYKFAGCTNQGPPLDTNAKAWCRKAKNDAAGAKAECLQKCKDGDLVISYDDGVCFPASAKVQMADGTTRAMRDLNVGDQVMSITADGSIAPSDIYAFPHKIHTGTFVFKEITSISSNNVSSIITATPDHYLFIQDSNNPGSWAHRKSVSASKVKAGDVMWVAQGKDLVASRVVDVNDVLEQGIVNPLTLEGSIIVEGVAASTYNTMLGSERTMHLATAWGRVLYKVAPSIPRALHNAGWASDIAMGYGHLARSVLSMTGRMSA